MYIINLTGNPVLVASDTDTPFCVPSSGKAHVVLRYSREITAYHPVIVGLPPIGSRVVGVEDPDVRYIVDQQVAVIACQTRGDVYCLEDTGEIYTVKPFKTSPDSPMRVYQLASVSPQPIVTDARSCSSYMWLESDTPLDDNGDDYREQQTLIHETR